MSDIVPQEYQAFLIEVKQRMRSFFAAYNGNEKLRPLVAENGRQREFCI